MPLSPTVKVGGDHCSRTVAPLFPHCYSYHPFYIFALSPTLTPVGDPLHYKRRPMCNVAGGSARGVRCGSVRFGVRNLDRPYARCSWFFKLPSSPTQYKLSRSRVLRVHRGPNLGKLPVCSLRSALRAPSALSPDKQRGSGPIGVRGGQFPPTSLAREVGGVGVVRI